MELINILLYLCFFRVNCIKIDGRYEGRLTQHRDSAIPIISSHCRFGRTLFSLSKEGRYYLSFLVGKIGHSTSFRVKYLERYGINAGNIRAIFNDPGIRRQWYFSNRRRNRSYLSHELGPIWQSKILGEGVVIGIIDGGVHYTHPDLMDNYNMESSYNYVLNTPNVYPSKHNGPTAMAGIISAVANNRKCGTGIAPLSKFASIQVFDDQKHTLEDVVLSKAIYRATLRVAVYLLNLISFSLKSMPYPGKYSISGFKFGSKYGRRTLGCVFITGSGNYGSVGNNCAFNGFLQLPEMFVFGAIFRNVSPPSYTERCTAVLAASLGTFDLNLKNRMYSTNNDNTCGNSIGGSQGAAAVSCGIIALLLSSNQNLTVRQLLVLIVQTSIQYDKAGVSNAAGYFYSYLYGFGVLDVKQLIKFSNHDSIKNLFPEHRYSTFKFIGTDYIKEHTSHILYIYTSGCLNSEFCVSKIEQLFITITLSTKDRSSIHIYLKSPSGTEFKIVEPRPYDTSSDGFNAWTIKVLGFFGESAVGVWKIEIAATKTSAILSMVRLQFHGTCNHSQLNLIRHDKARRFICSQFNETTSLLYKTICLPGLYNFDSRLKIDVCSFTGIAGSNIWLINYLLN